MTDLHRALRLAVTEKCRQHGGLRAAGRALGITAPYLMRLRDGDKVNPSHAVLRKLGLVRTITYTQTRSGRK